MAIIDELITLLGFDADDSEGKKFAGTLGTIKTAAAAVGTAVVAAEGAVLAFAHSVAGSTDELGKWGASFGEDIERIQQWEFATERAGGSASDLRNDISNLTKTLASPIPGEFNQALVLLGINIRDASGELKSGSDVLDEMIDKFAGLDAGQRQILASQVGLSESTLRFISQGRGEIERLSQLASDLGGVLDPEATVIAAEYADRMTDVNLIIGGIAKNVAISLLPGLTKSLETFEKWALANKDFIQAGLQEVVEGIGKGFEFIFNAGRRVFGIITDLAPELKELGEKGAISRLVFIGFVTTLGLLAAAFAPAILQAAAIGAAIAAAALIIEDFVSFVQGKQSVIGTFLDSFLERFPQAQIVIDNLKSLLSDLVAGIGPLFIGLGIIIQDVFKSAGDETTAFGQVINLVVNFGLGLINDFINIIHFLGKVIATVAAVFSGDWQTALEGTKEIFGDFFGAVEAGFTGFFGWINRLVEDMARVTTVITGDWSGAIDGAIESFGNFFGAIDTGFESLFGWIESLINEVGRLSGLWDSFKETFSLDELSAAGEEISNFAGEAVDSVGGFFSEQINSLKKAGEAIGETATKFGEAIGLPTAATAGVEGLGLSGAAIQETVNNFTQPAALQPIPATVASNKNVQGGNVSISNSFTINGAQSPQNTAQQISTITARQQSALTNSAQFGAFPGVD